MVTLDNFLMNLFLLKAASRICYKPVSPCSFFPFNVEWGMKAKQKLARINLEQSHRFNHQPIPTVRFSPTCLCFPPKLGHQVLQRKIQHNFGVQALVQLRWQYTNPIELSQQCLILPKARGWGWNGPGGICPWTPGKNCWVWWSFVWGEWHGMATKDVESMK